MSASKTVVFTTVVKAQPATFRILPMFVRGCLASFCLAQAVYLQSSCLAVLKCLWSCWLTQPDCRDQWPLQPLWCRSCFLFFSNLVLFLFILLKNGRIIAQHCCVSLCCTTMWLSHIHAHTHFLLSLPPPPHPSRPSQSVRLASLCYSEASHQLSILPVILYIFKDSTANPFPLPPFRDN